MSPLKALANPSPLLELCDVTRHYTLAREHLWQAAPQVHAVRGVSLTVRAGRNLGIVGESGSGKSTLARLCMALEAPNSGSIKVLGLDPHGLSAPDLRALRRHFQMVFQDPYGSLDPRHKVARLVSEPLLALDTHSRSDVRDQTLAMVQAVGLRATDLDKYTHEFSGGQRQRVAIARALITRPQLIVADEPVSALDVSVQAQVLNLMQDLSVQFGVTYLLISHDLAVVNHMCDEVAVIYQGRIVEQGPPQVVFTQAAHPYTRALLDAVPRMTPGPRRRVVAIQPTGSDAASIRNEPACAYAPRCPKANTRCYETAPLLRALDAGHRAACHWVE